MAIRTRMSKSGEKRVIKKKRANVGGPLNRAARVVSTGEAEKLTPGVHVETFGENRKQTKRRQVVLQNNRRRH